MRLGEMHVSDEPRLTRALPGAEATAHWLRCPVCGGALAMRALRTLGCASGHRFEAARQGYFNFLTGRGTSFIEDTQEMVGARDRVLSSGTYARLSSRVAELAAEHLEAQRAPGVSGEATRGAPGGDAALVLDCGVGTGHYLDRVLARLPGARGIGMDLSRQALRRASKVPGAIAIAWDLYRPWPVRDAVVDVLLDVFAPRNIPEAARVLRPGGLALVVTPLVGHLEQLAPLGLLGTHPGKAEQVEAAFLDTGCFRAEETLELREVRALPIALAADLVLMGPAGHHLAAAEVLARARVLSGLTPAAAASTVDDVASTVHTRAPDGCEVAHEIEVTLAFRIQRFRRLP